jgi:hypothetical protein
MISFPAVFVLKSFPGANRKEGRREHAQENLGEP